MNIKAQLDLVSQKTYAKAKVLDYYDGLNGLFPAEKVLLEKLFPKIEAYNTEGERIMTDTESFWIYYLANK